MTHETTPKLDAPFAVGVNSVVSRQFFHEITNEQWADMKASGMTWDAVMRRYAPPPWCGIGAEAVDPMGCWSLVSTRNIRCEDDCKNCPEYKGG